MRRRYFLHLAALGAVALAGVCGRSKQRNRSDAEKAVLCCLLLSGETLLEGAGKELRVDDFATLEHRVLFRTLLAMHSAKCPVDIVTVSQKLFSDGRLETAGGAERLSELYAFVPTPVNYPYYVDALRNGI